MKKTWQIGNLLALAFALIANFLVGAQMLNLPSISYISEKYATVLTPAGYAFSIWSLIYILLVAFAVYQARDLFKPKDENTLPDRVGPWFIIASLCNGLWTYVFVSELVGLSVVLLLVLSISLYILISRLNIAITDAPLKTIALVWWPLMIYAGWVTVASLVNMASWLESLQITVTPLLAHIVLVGLGASLIAWLVMRNVRELLLACVWGIVAIGVEQMSNSNPEAGSVAVTALTVASMLFVAVAVHVYVNQKSNLANKIIK